MGEVYRARDVRLKRDVAIKVLLPAVADDRERLARFAREAELLASLNHPNIAQIYGVEDSGGVRALAMEYVDGPTLDELIARRANARLTASEALTIARQIADALDSAHQRGIIHRDLKPANIKVTNAGTVKVLDFGLAKATERDDLVTRDSAATIPVEATRPGVIVGTLGYMSPEQARGLSVDKRTDIWAFGCVLYQMLTGSAPFTRVTASDTLAAVLEREPEWDRLPPSTPPELRRLLARCLTKDVKQRLRDIADGLADLEARAEAVLESRINRPGRRVAAVGWLVAICAIAVAAFGWVRAVRNSASANTPSVGPTLTKITWDTDFAVAPAMSPDGTLVAYAAPNGSGANLDLWLQRVGGGAPVRLTSNDADDTDPNFSPDGTSIAFRSERDGGGVYVMPALGGDARLIAPEGRKPQFSPDGRRIVYWMGSPLGGTRTPGTTILVVSANGGTPERLAKDFANARQPIWSPDGRGILFFGRRLASNQKLGVPQDVYGASGNDFDWWWLPVAGGEAVATGVYPSLLAAGVSFEPDTGLDSLPESWGPEGVVFSARLGQASNLWRVKLSETTGKIDGLPVRLTTGAGTDGGSSSDRIGRIAYQVAAAHETVFALPLNPNAAKATGPIESLATGWSDAVHRGSVSQDGRVLVYPRHRPTASEVWVKDLVTRTEHHLATTVFTQLNPTISPSGSQVAFTVVENERSSVHTVLSAGGVVRKMCDDCVVQGWVGEHQLLLLFPSDHPRVRLLDIDTTKMHAVFDADETVNRAVATPDGRWVVIGGGGDRAGSIWISALKSGQPSTPDKALSVKLPGSSVIPSRVAGWSPDGRVLYALMGLDGFRCLYALPIDLSKGTPPGAPQIVQHFHDPDRRWGSTPMGNAITNSSFIFDQVEMSSSIWLLDETKRDEPSR